MYSGRMFLKKVTSVGFGMQLIMRPILFAPEAIVLQDGATKNDCEKNAIKRYLAHVKREHPHLNLVTLLDGLYADNPTIELIRSYGWHYIIVAKDGNHKSLIEAMNALCDQGNLKYHEITNKEKGTKHWFRYANNVPLNASDFAENVNVLDYVETDKTSPEFQKALKERSKGVRTYLWKLITRIFLSWFLEGWDELFEAINKGIKPGRVKINTS